MRAEPPVFFAPPDFEADEPVAALLPDDRVPDDFAAAGFFAADDFAVEARDDDFAPPADFAAPDFAPVDFAPVDFAPVDFAPVDFAALERVDFAAAGFAADFAPPAFAPPDFAAVERVDFAAAGLAADFAPDDFEPDDLVPLDFEADDLEPLFLVAIFSNSFSVIDAAIGFDAPRSVLLGLSPRLADGVHRLAWLGRRLGGHASLLAGARTSPPLSRFRAIRERCHQKLTRA